MAAKSKRKKIEKTKQTAHERVLALLPKIDVSPNEHEGVMNDMRVIVGPEVEWVAYASKAKPGEVPKKLGIVVYTPGRVAAGMQVYEIDSGDGRNHDDFYRTISENGPEPEDDWQKDNLREIHILLEVLEEFKIITADEREQFVAEEEAIFAKAQKAEKIEEAVELLKEENYTVTPPTAAPPEERAESL